jgi:ABC-type sulfate/molybdate transport systems ATPase subunit
VALARAIAPEPSVLLLDEPFSNLDTTLRVQVRTELHHLLVELGVTAVFVTHDQEEAFVLGDEVAVMFDGDVVQQAPPWRLVSRVLLIPVIAGIAVEYIRWTANHLDSPLVRLLIKPNLALQSLTTREPDNSRLEVAIESINTMRQAEQEFVA